MICDLCAKVGQKSTVSIGATYVTAGGYSPHYDENGVFHSHDWNERTMTLSCSKGHHGKRVWQTACHAPDCDRNAQRKDSTEWTQ